jgi:hypothetical protein
MKAVRLHHYGGPEVLQHEAVPAQKPRGEVASPASTPRGQPAGLESAPRLLEGLLTARLAANPARDISGIGGGGQAESSPIRARR